MKRTMMMSLLVGSLAFGVGCKSTSSAKVCKCAPCTCEKPCPCATAASPGMMNETCPMSGKPLSGQSTSSTWNGQTIGFCGDGCKSKFDGMDTEAKNGYMARVPSPR